MYYLIKVIFKKLKWKEAVGLDHAQPWNSAKRGVSSQRSPEHADDTRGTDLQAGLSRGYLILSHAGMKCGVKGEGREETVRLGNYRDCYWETAPVAGSRRRDGFGGWKVADEENRGEKREEKNRGSGMGLEAGR